jgi:ATP diphosphatase
MIRRHPHVFGDEAARRAGVTKGFWERIKAEEKVRKAAERLTMGGASVVGVSPDRVGVLADVPLGMPALTRAVKLQAKAARVGFDWPSLAPVFEKMREELAELEEAHATATPDQVAEEFGDLMFVMANVARHLDLDPEACLRGANQKFERRFRRIEALLAEDGRTPAQSDLTEMDRLWDRAKAEEKGAPLPSPAKDPPA